MQTIEQAPAFARTARHPGAPDPVRIVSLAGPAMAVTITLEAGRNLRDAIAIPLAAAGIAGGTVRIKNLKVSPHHYLMPALSHDGKHAAFYSDPHEVAGGVTIELACATFGRRDGAPFVHCHAVWTDEQGRRRAGLRLGHPGDALRPLELRLHRGASRRFSLTLCSHPPGLAPARRRPKVCARRPRGPISAI